MATKQRFGTGIGANNAWTSSVPTANKWEDVDDPVGSPDDATAYLFATNAVSGTQQFTFSAFDVPAGATINSVKVKWRGIRVGATVTVLPVIRTGTTNRTGTAVALTTAWANHESIEWTTNPATTAAWEVDEVNGTDPTTTHRLVEFGMTSGPASGREAWVTQIYVEVDYTESGMNATAPDEPVKLTDTPIAQLALLLASATEAVKVSDSVSASFGLSAITTDAVKVADAVTPAMSLSAFVTEGIKVVDSFLQPAVHLAAAMLSAGSMVLSDGPPTTNLFTVGGALSASVSENVKLDDVGQGQVQLVGVIHVVDGPVIASMGASSPAAGPTETLRLQDVVTTRLNPLQAGVTDSLKISQTINALNSVLNASVGETLRLADAVDSYAELSKDEYVALADAVTVLMGGFELLERSINAESLKISDTASTALNRSVSLTDTVRTSDAPLFVVLLETGELALATQEHVKVSDVVTAVLHPIETSALESLLVSDDLSAVLADVAELATIQTEGLRIGDPIVGDVDLAVALQDIIVITEEGDERLDVLETQVSESIQITDVVSRRGLIRRSIIVATGSHVPTIFGTGSSSSIEDS